MKQATTFVTQDQIKAQRFIDSTLADLNAYQLERRVIYRNYESTRHSDLHITNSPRFT